MEDKIHERRILAQNSQRSTMSLSYELEIIQYKLLNKMVNTDCKEDTHGKAEEAGPKLGLPVIEELRLCLHKSREEITMSVLILAPVLEVLEDWVALVLRVLLQMPEDTNVPPVSNLLRQVGGVEDELGLEESVLPCLGQKPKVQRQIEVRQSFVQKPASPVSRSQSSNKNIASL